MKYNLKKVYELCESYICGNKGHVRKKAKKLNKIEFYYLVQGIQKLTDKEPEQIIYDLIWMYK